MILSVSEMSLKFSAIFILRLLNGNVTCQRRNSVLQEFEKTTHTRFPKQNKPNPNSVLCNNNKNKPRQPTKTCNTDADLEAAD